MKLNERSLAFYATCDSPADNAGFLFKKGERNTAYHRRWFVLKGNMLFYFEERESREPVGVIILEGCTVELCEAAEDFTFAIKFDCAKSRTYVLAAESQAAMESWVKSLSRASFDYLRLVVKELEKQLEEMQSGLAGSRSIQRRSPIYRKTKSALCLDTMAPALELPPARERPLVPPCAPLKENGCAVWNNVPCMDSLQAGDVPGGLADSGSVRTSVGGSHEGSVKPPPLPPRRRASSGNTCGPGALVADSPVCPGTVCFSKLHDWYGREITELRREWLESQESHKL
ncbi:sesquipedalian-1 [Trachemys scripta elegans]|uniref:sesquipedalian-1 n=1 Tax=Trachemys scripta elegans TaxID=31138 RepID=UPI00155319F7|nr:sesquipedalian-1 [Trachemys scripta elegans]